jgi:hypothetical protein
VAATLERICCTVAGCRVEVVPRVDADADHDPRVRAAVRLERDTMRMLGDSPEEIEGDLAETLDRSSFALVTSPMDELLGAVRFMLGGADGVKTLWDVERLAARPDHPDLARPGELVDAMSLAPDFRTGRPPAELADLLLGACTCLGGALLHAGRARFVTAYLHDRFLRHAIRIGYPVTPFVAADHPASGAFVPVVTSLAELDRLVRTSGPGTHLGDLRDEYVRTCALAGALGTERW